MHNIRDRLLQQGMLLGKYQRESKAALDLMARRQYDFEVMNAHLDEIYEVKVLTFRNNISVYDFYIVDYE